LAVPKRKDSGAPKKKAQAKGGQGRIESIRKYFRDIRNEFRKVIWPTRSDIGSQTVVVITTLVFFTIFIGVFDYIFSSIVGLVIQ